MSNNDDPKIISLKDFRNQKNTDEPLNFDEIWEYPELYEYRLIPDYDLRFESTHIDSIDIGGCFANLIKEGKNYYLVSIYFDKNIGIPTLIDWLDFYKIELFQPSNTPITIHNTDGVFEAIKYRGHPIVLSMRGEGTAELNPSKLIEVVDEFKAFQGITNTRVAEQVNIENHIFDE